MYKTTTVCRYPEAWSFRAKVALQEEWECRN